MVCKMHSPIQMPSSENWQSQLSRTRRYSRRRQGSKVGHSDSCSLGEGVAVSVGTAAPSAQMELRGQEGRRDMLLLGTMRDGRSSQGGCDPVPDLGGDQGIWLVVSISVTLALRSGGTFNIYLFSNPQSKSGSPPPSLIAALSEPPHLLCPTCSPFLPSSSVLLLHLQHAIRYSTTRPSTLPSA